MAHDHVVPPRSQKMIERAPRGPDGAGRAHANGSGQVYRGGRSAKLPLDATCEAQRKVHRDAFGVRPVKRHRPKECFYASVQVAAVHVKHADPRAVLTEGFALEIGHSLRTSTS
jgi:hypothetical protein